MKGAIAEVNFMVRAYRVYYTTFYDDEHERIIEKLKSVLGVEPVIHSSMIKEFRYLEFIGNELVEGKDEDIKKTVKEVLGEDAYVRVDYINL